MNGTTSSEISKPSTDIPGVLIFPPALPLGTLLLSILLNRICPLHFPDLIWIKVAGGLLALLGIGLTVWGRTTMMRAGTNVPPHKPTLTIVTDGPFRFTRNPLYTGGTALYLGLSLAFNLVWAFIFLAPMLFLLNWGIIGREERYLEKKFGATYLDYKARVRRWI